MRYGAPTTVGIIVLVLILVLAGAVVGMTDPATVDNAPEPLVIHFESNRAVLNAAQKSMIRGKLSGLNLKKTDTVFVVGYSDASGDKIKNERLSNQRAQAVRKEIVAVLGERRESPVLVLGRGENNPVADNRRKEGRAKNRRVEVYLGQLFEGRTGVGEPLHLDLPVVEPLVFEAMDLLRRQRLSEALEVLHKARHYGAEGYGGWHTAHGIAGYYAGIDAQTSKSHLLAALVLDPFDLYAREYLGRLEALEDLVAGRVTPGMGRHEDAAIPVKVPAQAHEYLRLFEVQPLSRHRLAHGPLEAWVCRDRQGRSVTYYFDHSQVHAWAFARPASGALAALGRSDAKTATALETGRPPAGNRSVAPVDSHSRAERIWDIKLFR